MTQTWLFHKFGGHLATTFESWSPSFNLLRSCRCLNAPPYDAASLRDGFLRNCNCDGFQPTVVPWKQQRLGMLLAAGGWAWKLMSYMGIWGEITFYNSVVVSKMFYFHPENWGNDPIWRSAYFSNGLVQPSTRITFYKFFGVFNNPSYHQWPTLRIMRSQN